MTVTDTGMMGLARVRGDYHRLDPDFEFNRLNGVRFEVYDGVG